MSNATPTLPQADDAPSPTDDIVPTNTNPYTPAFPSLAHHIPPDDDDSTADSSTSIVSTSHFPTVHTTSVSTTQPLNPDASAVDHYDITRRDIAQIYCLPHHYGYTFEEVFDYMGSASTVHDTAGLVLEEVNDRVFIRDIAPGTPCAKIPRWKTRLRHTCLVAINDMPITSMAEVASLISHLPKTPRGTCRLLVTASELRDGLTNEGIPQITLDQLNPRHFFRIPSHTGHHSNSTIANMIRHSWDGGVLQYLTRAHKLTRGILLKQSDWQDWQNSEFLQLDQYELQGMFGDLVLVSSNYAVFNLVWTYVIKEVDGRKKARCTCDGSTRGGQVRVLDHTYANSPDQTCTRILYALAAAENLVIYGANVSNAFAEAPPPQQGFYL